MDNGKETCKNEINEIIEEISIGVDFNVTSYTNKIKIIQGDMSGKDISDILNISEGTWTSYRKGKKPTADVLIKISKKLNVSIDWLLGLDERDTNKGGDATIEIDKSLRLLVGVMENKSFLWKIHDKAVWHCDPKYTSEDYRELNTCNPEYFNMAIVPKPISFMAFIVEYTEFLNSIDSLKGSARKSVIDNVYNNKKNTIIAKYVKYYKKLYSDVCGE